MSKAPAWKTRAKKRIAQLKGEIWTIEALIELIEERGKLIDTLARKVEMLEEQLGGDDD